MFETALLQAVASPRRREILRMVWENERTAGEIHQSMPDVTFGAVSLHLKQLNTAGLVSARSKARFRYYKANREVLGPMAQILEQMWDDALWRLKLEAELEQTRRGPRRKPSEKGS